jgi:hypothetical protein
MRAVLMLVITWMVLSPEIVTKTQAAPAREDAADQVSAYIMLQLGKVEARRLIETSASELRRNPITGTAACCARFPAFRCRVPPGP